MLRHLLLLLPLLSGVFSAESGDDLRLRLAALEKGALSPPERCALGDAAASVDGEVALAVLAALVADRCRQVREHALAAFQASRPARLDTLIDGLAGQHSPSARAGAAFAATAAHGWAALELLNRLAGDPSPVAIPVRFAVATALGTLGDPTTPQAGARAIALASALAGDKDLRVRLAAIAALARRGSLAEAQRSLESLLTDPVEEVARQALEALLANGVDQGRLTTALAGRLRGGNDVQERIVIANALGRIGGTAAATALVETLAGLGNGRLQELRAALCDALGQIACADPAVVKRCEAVLPALLARERWPGARLAAIWALMRMQSRLAVPAAIEVLPRQGDEDLLWLLQRYTGQSFTQREQWQAWWTKNAATWNAPGAFALKAASAVDFYQVPDSSEDITFIIDISGSMAEPTVLAGDSGKAATTTTKLAAAKVELWRSLRGLEAGTRVSLLWFSFDATAWGDGPVQATWRNKVRLREAFAGIQPVGGTNAWAVLSAALTRPGGDSIYFLTDGQPTVGISTDIAEITKEMQELNHDRPATARIHSIAFHLQVEMNDKEREKARKRREEQERLAKAAGRPPPPEDPAIEQARVFLRRLSADSGGVFREVR